MKNKLVAAMIGVFILGFAGFAHADVIGNKDSKIFHSEQCSMVKQMKAENKVVFKSADEAIKAGYKECKKCAAGKAADKAVKAKFVGSKDGKKYHKATCKMVANIKPDNLVEFATEDEAKKAGYTPCSHCFPDEKKEDTKAKDKAKK